LIFSSSSQTNNKFSLFPPLRKGKTIKVLPFGKRLDLSPLVVSSGSNDSPKVGDRRDFGG
jgi:hypothetical protein